MPFRFKDESKLYLVLLIIGTPQLWLEGIRIKICRFVCMGFCAHCTSTYPMHSVPLSVFCEAKVGFTPARRTQARPGVWLCHVHRSFMQRRNVLSVRGWGLFVPYVLSWVFNSDSILYLSQSHQSFFSAEIATMQGRQNKGDRVIERDQGKRASIGIYYIFLVVLSIRVVR